MPQPTTPTILTVAAGSANWQAEINSNFAALLAHLTGGPLPVKVYTIATLPPAAEWQQCIAFVSDPATDKGMLVYCDGTDWRYVSDATTL
ncbi:MAG TPA: hypothetical protein VGN72_10025 [Tepidisphaeraceae bacterium]|jgi:hypothetical protein|nr:hypothetical protein [Tepidisphaeraceae bacterium]